MSGPWTFARMHGVIPCAGVILLYATATAFIGALPVSAGWLTDATAVTVPLSSFLPALSVMCFYSVTGGLYLGEDNAARPLRVYRWLLLGALVAFALLAPIASTAAVSQVELGVVTARNLLGSLGLVLALRPLLDDAAWLCPAMFASAELLFGGSAYGEPPSWAWTLQPVTSDSAIAIATALLLLGTLVLGRNLGREPRLS